MPSRETSTVLTAAELRKIEARPTDDGPSGAPHFDGNLISHPLAENLVAAPLNEIPTKQNSDDALWLMRARQRVYGIATFFQITQILAAVVAPTVFSVIGMVCPTARPYLAAASLALLLVDLFVLDRAQQFFLRRAARIAEQFDCCVLELPWNKFIAGAKVDDGDIEAAASAFGDKASDMEKIRNWYPQDVGRAPLHIARIVCQFENTRYDVKLRRRHAMVVAALPAIIVVATIIAWATLDLTFGDVVLTILTPAAPVAVWALREAFRHSDAAAAQERIKEAVDGLRADIAKHDADALLLKAREFQDAIFLRRVASPLIFPLVYHVLRSKMESQMNTSADKRLKEAGY